MIERIPFSNSTSMHCLGSRSVFDDIEINLFVPKHLNIIKRFSVFDCCSYNDISIHAPLITRTLSNSVIFIL